MTITSLANLALSQVPAGGITNIDENSVQARFCKLWYPQILSELLPKGPWVFASVRAALAVKTNDRPNEWGFAFAAPGNMAFPVQVLDEGGLGPMRYTFAATTIYTQVPNAQVDMVTTDDMSASYDGLFKAAVIAWLAARVCVPITKQFKREADLIRAAETATDRAVAFAYNQSPPQGYMDNYIPDVLKARGGYLVEPRIYPSWDAAGLPLGVTGL